MRKEKNTYFVKIKQKRLEKYYNMCYNYFHNKQIKEYCGKGEGTCVGFSFNVISEASSHALLNSLFASFKIVDST